MTTIYALCDPVTSRVRYIGKTRNLKARISCHMVCVRDNVNKAEWLQSLRDVGRRPVVKELEFCRDDRAEKAEQRWISEFCGTDGFLNVRVAERQGVEAARDADDERKTGTWIRKVALRAARAAGAPIEKKGGRR